MNTKTFTVLETTWADHQTMIRHIRQIVFVQEQQVPAALEWADGEDAYHYVLALDAAEHAIGTGRISPAGHIGRMAVLSEWRNNGVGSALLNTLVRYADQQTLGTLHLNAQTSAVPFYEKYGFKTQGEMFLDAGIPHKAMSLSEY